MDEKIKINIHLKKDTVEKINKIVNYKNLKTELIHLNETQIHTMEDFITGCVNYYMKQLANREEYAGMDDLGKPYRLKNNFKKLLKSKGWKQKDLADITNIDPANISIILSNRSQPSLDYFLRLWVAFGCPPLNKVLEREK
jgi:DNA-binding XRE family transcriptional regulator